MKYIVTVIIFHSLAVLVCANDYRYDKYSGKVINEEVFRKGNNKNCTITVKHCKPHEGSRVDGTCNNYKQPTRGSARGPYLRLLNPDYANDKQDVRKDRNGDDLPSARRVRTTLQTDGRVVDKHDFNVAAFHYLQFIHFDVSVLNGPMDYLVKRQHCCKPEGRLDRRCKPIPVPNDDPYLRVTDIRCLNFSRAETFQDNGCIDGTTTPEQINFQTPVIDLSTIYGVDEKGLKSVRLYKHGLLKLEYRDFRHVPLANLSSDSNDPVTTLVMLTPQVLGNLTMLNSQPLGNSTQLKQERLRNMTNSGNLTMVRDLTKSDNLTISKRPSRQNTVPVSLPTTGGLNDAILTPVMEVTDEVTPPLMNIVNMTVRNETTCIQNMNNETRCYRFGYPEAGNFDLRTTTFAIFFMREHNRLAKALHRINPCWKDDRLFKVARQINIATASNILMYELLPMLLGYKNMLKYGLISNHVQHITAYDEDAVPLVYAEFEIALRYYHTLLDGRIKLYDEKYHYDREFSVSNTTFRQNLIEMNKSFEKINRGTFYQHAGKVDDIHDPEISEKYYGDLQRAADLPALDIQRGRDLGVRGYNDYRHICGMKPVKKFEDFADVMDYEKIESLKKLYVEIEDIDLLAGIMSEKFMPGTFAGPTLFCIITKQLQLFRFADRFWFERGDQFHSLTLPQLHEIRKTNIARFACDNADAIKFLQPRAFENVGPHNEHVPCTHIPGLDITMWKDISCYNDKLFDHDHPYNEHELKNHWAMKKNGNVNEKRQRFTNTEGKHENKMQWSINQYGKYEEKTHWPMHKDSKIHIQKDNKDWALNQDDGKYKEEKQRHWNEDDGKYDDKIDWPNKNYGKQQSQWTFRENNHVKSSHSNVQPFASSSHQNFQSDGSDFTPFFQNLFSVT